MSESLLTRCPRLGGEVPFTYCLREMGDLPCQRVVICWQPYFPVDAYLRAKLTPAQWDECFNRKPRDKVATLIELVEESKRGMGDEA
ncbi:MAG: hypothetical protein WAW37_17460 [Syntrophobacteraceae bacterium]